MLIPLESLIGFMVNFDGHTLQLLMLTIAISTLWFSWSQGKFTWLKPKHKCMNALSIRYLHQITVLYKIIFQYQGMQCRHIWKFGAITNES